jgi:hypothetical protein
MARRRRNGGRRSSPGSTESGTRGSGPSSPTEASLRPGAARRPLRLSAHGPAACTVVVPRFGGHGVPRHAERMPVPRRCGAPVRRRPLAREAKSTARSRPVLAPLLCTPLGSEACLPPRSRGYGQPLRLANVLGRSNRVVDSYDATLTIPTDRSRRLCMSAGPGFRSSSGAASICVTSFARHSPAPFMSRASLPDRERRTGGR